MKGTFEGRLGPIPEGPVLTAAMSGLGMNLAAEPNFEADIERTLAHAASAGMDVVDLRTLAVLTTWLEIHHPYVNTNRLARFAAGHRGGRVGAYWAAVARWLGGDRRFAKLADLHEGPPVDLLPVGTDFQIARRGEDPRFAGSPLRVPEGALRRRESDALPPAAVARRHTGYRNRVAMGPTWRADLWTAIGRGRELSAANAARRVGRALSAAWRVAMDYRSARGPGA